MKRTLAFHALLLMTALLACTRGAGKGEPTSGSPASSVKTDATPSDPRVICPPGATQARLENFGAQEVYCVESSGAKHGPSFLWLLANGQLLRQQHFAHGQMEGTQRSWYRNGQSRLEWTCHDGMLDGSVRFWHENGQLEYEGWRDRGRRIKVWRWWNERGQLVRTRDYGDGSKEPPEPCVSAG